MGKQLARLEILSVMGLMLVLEIGCVSKHPRRQTPSASRVLKQDPSHALAA
jgi:hypothetical protein